MDAKKTIIDKWRTRESPDFAYFDKFEPLVDMYWSEGSIYLEEFKRLDLTAVVELACGKGRHAAQIADKCGSLVLADTSPDAIEFCRERFALNENVSAIVIEDGESLPFISDESISAIFSYDAMVHFEPLTVAAYLREFGRILVPGGHALIQHSNLASAPDKWFTQNVGWRNFMSHDLMRHFAHRAGLQILVFKEIEKDGEPYDALSLLQKT